jgi:hypothetical protein
MNIFITLDYEIFFGSNSGTQERCILHPTKLLLDILNQYNIKATFFIDSGYLIKMDEHRTEFPQIEKDYQEVIAQILELDKDGHDIQLHIHPHWEDSFYDGEKWILDTTRYKLHDFSSLEIADIIHRYKKVLTNIVGDKVFVYRAGGWCMQPFAKIEEALKRENIWLDSTVFRGGLNESITHSFDFREMPKLDNWMFDKDPLVVEKKGFFREIPISSYRVSPLFFWKLAFFKKLGSSQYRAFGDGSAAGGSKWDKFRMLFKPTFSVVSIDGMKIDFLEKAYQSYKKKLAEHFVLIGHQKSLTPYSLKKLELFFIKHRNENFTTYRREFIDEK